MSSHEKNKKKKSWAGKFGEEDTGSTKNPPGSNHSHSRSALKAAAAAAVAVAQAQQQEEHMVAAVSTGKSTRRKVPLKDHSVEEQQAKTKKSTTRSSAAVNKQKEESGTEMAEHAALKSESSGGIPAQRQVVQLKKDDRRKEEKPSIEVKQVQKDTAMEGVSTRRHQVPLKDHWELVDEDTAKKVVETGVSTRGQVPVKHDGKDEEEEAAFQSNLKELDSVIAKMEVDTGVSTRRQVPRQYPGELDKGTTSKKEVETGVSTRRQVPLKDHSKEQQHRKSRSLERRKSSSRSRHRKSRSGSRGSSKSSGSRRSLVRSSGSCRSVSSRKRRQQSIRTSGFSEWMDDFPQSIEIPPSDNSTIETKKEHTAVPARAPILAYASIREPPEETKRALAATGVAASAANIAKDMEEGTKQTAQKSPASSNMDQKEQRQAKSASLKAARKASHEDNQVEHGNRPTIAILDDGRGDTNKDTETPSKPSSSTSNPGYSRSDTADSERRRSAAQARLAKKLAVQNSAAAAASKGADEGQAPDIVPPALEPGAVSVPAEPDVDAQVLPEQQSLDYYPEAAVTRSTMQTVGDVERGSSPHYVCAEMVDEPVLAHATPMPDVCARLKQHKRKLLIAAVAIVLVIVAITLGVTLSKDGGSSDDEPAPQAGNNSTTPPESIPPPPPPAPTLASVTQAGVLRCGVPDKLGFSEFDEETGERLGFEVDLCRAVAAAALGESFRIETVVLSSVERFVALANRSVDVVANAATHNMERDVFEARAMAGMSFTVPYLYDGLGFGGVPPFGMCANDLNTLGDCARLKVCVEDGTTHIDILERLLPDSVIAIKENDKAVYKGLIDGDCNAIAGEQFNIVEITVRHEGYMGAYEVGNNSYSKEPLALVTIDGDQQWADFVNWVLQALLSAEAQGITQALSISIGTTSVFGVEYENMFIDAIAAVGNYGELYERHLEAIFLRQGLNQINKVENPSGLLYAHPFGTALLSTGGPGPITGGTLETVVQRGFLRCGVTDRAGFGQFNLETGEWTGLDVDYCRALSASVFGGVVDTIKYVEIVDRDARFKSLADGDVDVLAGSSVNIERDVLDSGSGEGYSFSQPYFYGGEGLGEGLTVQDSFALATREDDTQWSDFVYWIVTSTFYAETKNITRETSNDMPRVNLFGPSFDRMLRDAILVVGNYRDLYARNVEQFIPRSGRNTLNERGPQHFPLPGI